MAEDMFITENNDLQVDSDAEESLSLCDLPLYGNDFIKEQHHHHHLQTPSSSSSTDQELFEFFIDMKTETTTNMSSAEDIILCGKLLPYRSPTPLSKFPNKTTSVDDQIFEFPPKKLLRRGHRKSESLNDLPEKSHSSPKIRFIRSSHSLDFHKLNRDSSSKITRTRSLQPRWRLMMFGFMKTPTEIELKDIKNRQNRRIPSTMFPMHYGEETVSVKREEEKGSWRLLRVLSCKGEANGVIPSLSCIPHV
ncbi:hypothetical protein FRX31_003360 [Thalictrum thalictroides]|uniref:Membrane-associated kinase regulator n=1 Tax=Thalictrum thalictroides TaxID=46969 RepID=A0A7J6XFA4_THATH|nr:hypothetical protein FRX31_003360 [Thalictrum thalictroides]